MNFVETIFYDELGSDDKSPIPGTLGAVLEEEDEGGGTHNLRNLLEKERQKKETSSLGSQEYVVVWELGGRLIYRL